MLKLLGLIFSIIFAIQSQAQTVQRADAPTLQPVMPAPLPQLPPTLAEQALPYPLEFIDRPYTLPVGLQDFTLRTSVVSPSEDPGAVYWPLYMLDVKYRRPLTNDFTLVWNPLPLGILHQPKRTSETVTGVSWS